MCFCKFSTSTTISTKSKKAWNRNKIKYPKEFDARILF